MKNFRGYEIKTSILEGCAWSILFINGKRFDSITTEERSYLLQHGVKEVVTHEE